MIFRAWIAVALSLAPLAGSAQPLTWHDVERAVHDRLSKEDLVLAARTAALRPPAHATVKELLIRINILVRAGLRKPAARLLPRLAQARAPHGIVDGLADGLIDRKEFDLAQRVLELFPKVIPGWTYVLIKHWRDSGRPAAQIDLWLARQSRREPQWILHHVAFRRQLGTEKQLLDKLAADVRAHPSDLDRLVLLLNASRDSKLDLTWIGKVYRPATVLDALAAAASLRRAPSVKVKLLERALGMGITVTELDRYRSRMQILITRDRARRALDHQRRIELAQAYREAGQHSKAQRMMEAVVKQGGQVGSFTAHLAGQVQRGSGARTIERRIVAAEPKKKSSPDYWLARAAYYEGRREDKQARAAFDKALALAPKPRPKNQPTKGGGIRRHVLIRYARYLALAKRPAAAEALLRAEIKRYPWSPTADTAVYWLLELDREHKHPIDPADPVLWGYLGRRVEWEIPEEKLLWRLLERTPKPGRGRAYGRAERLARQRNPTRAKVLGWVLTRMNERRRAVPLLRIASDRLVRLVRIHRADILRHSRYMQALESVRFNLFETYLELGQWRPAERLFPEVRARLTPGEVITWYAQLAQTAARKGQAAAALRIWRRLSNLDPSALDHLGDLARTSLRVREGLRRHYQKLAKQLPDSWVPGRALAILAGS